jgi:RimJ/RimL family protein N-acetyltransferase
MSMEHENTRILSVRDRLARMAPKRAIEILGPELLRTPRLVMRPLVEQDRGAFVEAIRESRPQLEPYFDLWRPGDDDETVFDRQRELTRLGAAKSVECRRAAFLSDDRGERFVGCFNLSNIRRGLEFTAEASWWVRSNLSGMGLGSEGVKGMLEYAIGSPTGNGGGLGLTEVVALLHPDNAASRRLAERVGMHAYRAANAAVLMGDEWVPHVAYRKVAAVMR